MEISSDRARLDEDNGKDLDRHGGHAGDDREPKRDVDCPGGDSHGGGGGTKG